MCLQACQMRTASKKTVSDLLNDTKDRNDLEVLGFKNTNEYQEFFDEKNDNKRPVPIKRLTVCRFQCIPKFMSASSELSQNTLVDVNFCLVMFRNLTFLLSSASRRVQKAKRSENLTIACWPTRQLYKMLCVLTHLRHCDSETTT